MRSRRSRGMHHLFINLHVKYKYNNYLHFAHAHAARSHTRSSWHLPFTKHRRFLQQTKYQKRANCGLRCHSQRSCSCQTKIASCLRFLLLLPPRNPREPLISVHIRTITKTTLEMGRGRSAQICTPITRDLTLY